MSDGKDWTDEELARSAKRGDTDAFDALVRRYLRPAMALAWQYTRGVEDAEDVVQEAFHRVVRALPDYDDRRPFGAWFYAIVRNAARSAIGKDWRRAVLAPFTSMEDEPAAPMGFDPFVVEDIERAIDALAPMQQACVRLCDIEGFTSVEVSRMLGVGEGTVRTHLQRARKQLRSALAGQKR
ncbi:MAG TPA: RNA polymerase sigma factor [Vicinamibacteria bacterium]|nr:RNA polymerase sigma factor [Vicinamibacteria bacterium]